MRKQLETLLNVMPLLQVVLLMWGVSQRDMEMAAKILSQVCLAHRSSQGTTVAVLSQLEKFDMESHFRRVLPDAARFGCRWAFRQGKAFCSNVTCRMHWGTLSTPRP